MLFHTSLNALSPSAVNGSGSAIAAVFCTRRLFHTPDRSARPSAVRGTGVPSGVSAVAAPPRPCEYTGGAGKSGCARRITSTAATLLERLAGGFIGRSRENHAPVPELPRAGVARVGAVL